MELKTTDIVEAAGRIIIESGTDSLSIKELAGRNGDKYFFTRSIFEER